MPHCFILQFHLGTSHHLFSRCYRTYFPARATYFSSPYIVPSSPRISSAPTVTLQSSRPSRPPAPLPRPRYAYHSWRAHPAPGSPHRPHLRPFSAVGGLRSVRQVSDSRCWRMVVGYWRRQPVSLPRNATNLASFTDRCARSAFLRPRGERVRGQCDQQFSHRCPMWRRSKGSSLKAAGREGRSRRLSPFYLHGTACPSIRVVIMLFFELVGRTEQYGN